MIPNFTNEGKLPSGIHICSGEEFLKVFCNTELRKNFEKSISDIFDYAKDRGAVKLFIGGSFISANKNPDDFDCIIVFREDEYIPNNIEKIQIEGLKFDILFASLESPNLIDAYLKLFSTCKYGGTNVGVVQLDIYKTGETWEVRHEPSAEDFEIIKQVYINRSFVNLREKRGVLVSIHGLLSRAEWNKEIAPVASSQDWIFAPYMYDINKPTLLFDKKIRAKVLDDFREWLYDLQARFNQPISIIAHSFGTYVVGAYLEGFDPDECPPVTFNSLILTGSILNTDFDWEKYRGLSVGSVYNNIAPNDEFVKYMPETDLKRFIGMSTTFGRAGKDGFKSTSPMLVQSTNQIFSHTNTIKRDIIESKWLPFLNANRFAMNREMPEYFKRKYSK